MVRSKLMFCEKRLFYKTWVSLCILFFVTGNSVSEERYVVYTGPFLNEMPVGTALLEEFVHGNVHEYKLVTTIQNDLIRSGRELGVQHLVYQNSLHRLNCIVYFKSNDLEKENPEAGRQSMPQPGARQQHLRQKSSSDPELSGTPDNPVLQRQSSNSLQPEGGNKPGPVFVSIAADICGLGVSFIFGMSQEKVPVFFADKIAGAACSALSNMLFDWYQKPQ